MKNLALIVAAGSGSRFGDLLPKQYQLLGGKPILAHSIEAFLNHPEIDAVRVVIATDDKLYDFNRSKLLPPVIGGAERQDSVRLGLESLQEFAPQNVLIHDAARPFVTKDVIDNVLSGLKKHQAVIPVIAAADSARYEGVTLERDKLKLVQTPQGFDYEMILAAHQSANRHRGLVPRSGSGISAPNSFQAPEQVRGDGIYTDDAQIAESAGVKIHFVEGDVINKKITTKDDLMNKIQQTRIGSGFDVHEFETGTHVTICGIKIPHTHQLKGHSDADVGLHAITDAILGAIGAGDIGEHFPPSDPKWRNADSSVFLKHAASLIKGEIGNVDVTIICEEPKLTPYKGAMKKKVAEILGISSDRINIKATTTEGLGFTGRKEGISAQAVATVIVDC